MRGRWYLVGAAGGLALLLVVAGTWLILDAERRARPLDSATMRGTSSDDPLDDRGYAVWERNDDGEPVRFDPCRPIEVTISADGAYGGFERDVEVAVERLARASGLDLAVTGETDERPSGDRAPYQPSRYGDRWAPVLVAVAAPHESGLDLRDTDRGLALPIAVGDAGDRSFVTGQVVLNADRTDLRAGFTDREDSWGATLLHELAHVLGLDHVDDPAQLLSTYPGRGPVRFGAGDRAGLRAVGAAAGCAPAPTPRHVEVAPPP